MRLEFLTFQILCIEIGSFISFLKNPIIFRIENNDNKVYRLKTLISLLIFDFFLMLVLTCILGVFRYLQLLPEISSDLVNGLMKENSIWWIIIALVIITPLFEEFIFRYFLKMEIAIKLPFWDKYFGYIYYLSASIFGLVHLFNFNRSDPSIYLYPLLISPQFFLGLFTGYLRVKFSLIWSIYFHSIHNAAFLFLSILLE